MELANVEAAARRVKQAEAGGIGALEMASKLLSNVLSEQDDPKYTRATP